MTEEIRDNMNEITNEKDIVQEEKEEKKASQTTEPSSESEKDGKKKTRHLEAEVLDLKKKLEKAEAALSEKTEQCLRIAAEYENYRKRTARERESIFADAYGEALTALFPVIDNLERAAAYADGENVAKGVALTLKSVKETLDKLGVQEIEAEGKPFDPQRHNAVMHIEDPELGEGVVAEVLQKGYCIGDRVLRYAMVKVAN